MTLPFCREASPADMRSPDLLHLLAVAVSQRGRVAEAESLLREAITLRPDDAGLLYDHGVALGKLGRQREAAEAGDPLGAIGDHDHAAAGRSDDLFPQQGAAALALAASPDPAAGALLKLRPELAAEIEAGRLTWETLAA